MFKCSINHCTYFQFPKFKETRGDYRQKLHQRKISWFQEMCEMLSDFIQSASLCNYVSAWRNKALMPDSGWNADTETKTWTTELWLQRTDKINVLQQKSKSCLWQCYQTINTMRNFPIGLQFNALPQCAVCACIFKIVELPSGHRALQSEEPKLEKSFEIAL